ncbi:MAG: Calx-beta domain-containing protein, partial [Dolichospermum sp.]
PDFAPQSTYHIRVRTTDNTGLTFDKPLTINVLDTGVLSISDVSIGEGNSGITNAAFTVNLTDPFAGNVTVNYATVNGTAYSGYDFNATSGSLTFAPGETTKTVNVGVIGDVYNEGNETFKLQLSNPTNATLSKSFGTGTIIDDDAAPTLSINSISLAEGNSGTRNATFNVSLSAAAGQAVTVNYATADGTATIADNDYTASSGTLTFAPGNTSLTINVPIVGDTKIEANETFFVNLNNANGATLATSQGTGTILDDDGVPSLTLNGTSGND